MEAFIEFVLVIFIIGTICSLFLALFPLLVVICLIGGLVTAIASLFE